MSSKTHQQMTGTLRDASSPRRSRKLPDWIKVVTTAFFVVPTITTFAYSSGMWAPKNDTLDNILTSGSVMCGVVGVIMIHFVIKYLEDIGG